MAGFAERQKTLEGLKEFKDSFKASREGWEVCCDGVFVFWCSWRAKEGGRRLVRQPSSRGRRTSCSPSTRPSRLVLAAAQGRVKEGV